MHVMRESWTDAHLDDFRAEVNRRFEKVENEISELCGEVKELRGEMKSGFESIHKTMINAVIILSASYIAGFAALVGLVATQI
jgi:uncharacterized protein (UPF0335 family)